MYNKVRVTNIFYRISEIRPNLRGTISFRERNFHLISHRRRVRDNGGKLERAKRVVGSHREHTRQQFCPEYLVILAFLGWTRDTREGQEPREKEIVETRKRQRSGELGMM